MDLTELTDMSDQELAEVFADSDEEAHSGSPAGTTRFADRHDNMSANVQNKCKKEQQNLLGIKLISFISFVEMRLRRESYPKHEYRSDVNACALKK